MVIQLHQFSKFLENRYLCQTIQKDFKRYIVRGIFFIVFWIFTFILILRKKIGKKPWAIVFDFLGKNRELFVFDFRKKIGKKFFEKKQGLKSLIFGGKNWEKNWGKKLLKKIWFILNF